MRTASVVWVLVCVLLALAAAGWATEVMYQSPKQLADESSRIVRGTVVSVRSYWNAGHTTILTETRIKVAETYKGAKTPEAVVVQLGGVVGHVKVNVEGALSWRPAEEVLLFLESNPDGAYQIAGFSQGKFAIERDARTGEAYVKSPAFEGVSLVGAPPGGAKSMKAPLDQFIDETMGRR
jgi:hypothetical protein